MKAIIKENSFLNHYYAILHDGDDIVGTGTYYPTESEAIAACRKYFPQFKLEGEQGLSEALPEAWCVLNDGSKEFYDAVIAWMNKRDDDIWIGNMQGRYYGVNPQGKSSHNDTPFGQLLTLSQFTQLTK